jgi:hypothetical protein
MMNASTLQSTPFPNGVMTGLTLSRNVSVVPLVPLSRQLNATRHLTNAIDCCRRGREQTGIG